MPLNAEKMKGNDAIAIILAIKKSTEKRLHAHAFSFRLSASLIGLLNFHMVLQSGEPWTWMHDVVCVCFSALVFGFGLVLFFSFCSPHFPFSRWRVLRLCGIDNDTNTFLILRGTIYIYTANKNKANTPHWANIVAGLLASQKCDLWMAETREKC